jgi:hypothetical protein
VDLIRCAFDLASHTIGRVTHWMDARGHEGAGRSHVALKTEKGEITSQKPKKGLGRRSSVDPNPHTRGVLT